MKLTTKKIIAREFLALLLVMTIGLLAFLSIYAFNSFKENKISKLSNEVSITSKQIDSLSFAYIKKLYEQSNSKIQFAPNYTINQIVIKQTNAD